MEINGNINGGEKHRLEDEIGTKEEQRRYGNVAENVRKELKKSENSW